MYLEMYLYCGMIGPSNRMSGKVPAPGKGGNLRNAPRGESLTREDARGQSGPATKVKGSRGTTHYYI